MNNKTKFLVPALAGIVLSSGLSLSNVQAKDVTANAKLSTLTVGVTSMSTSYQTYYSFGYADTNNMAVYLRIPGVTASSFQGWLINEERIPASVAVNVAPYLYSLGGDYIDSLNNGRGITVLRSTTSPVTYKVISA
ncbi:hypothetical protein CF095_13725 [Clostridium botulinum]